MPAPRLTVSAPALPWYRIPGFWKQHRDVLLDKNGTLGGHVASVEQVADGSVDAAAIDCVTYSFLSEFRPDLVRATRVLARTDPSPAIPFVTIDDADHGRLVALRAALARLSSEARFAPALLALRMTSIGFLEDAAYSVLGSYEHEAAAAGYPVLC